jgi:hypothetical protein
MTDPYEIAITTYALTLCDSTEKEFAFNVLHSRRLEVAGMMEFGCNQNTNQDFPTVSQILPFLVTLCFQKVN